MTPFLAAVAVAIVVTGGVAATPAHAGGGASAAAHLPSTNVAWQPAANDADVDRAFAVARLQEKPVLLYWGASWCPPCNQLKATLFNRQDFATLSRSLVAVAVDGDLPGAQRLGQRFKVSGYPTVVLFTAEGKEITRLPGEVDAPQVLAVLRLGLAGGRPVKAVLADALAGRPLSPAEWRLLAFYSWETDEQQLVPKADVATTLVQLAVASPPAETELTTRLWLQALAASDEGKGVKGDAALRERVMAVLSDPARARLQMDVISNGAADIVRALAPEAGASRVALGAAFDAALTRLQADATLSRGDRLQALYARVELARLDVPKKTLRPKLPATLLKEVRQVVARDDREITDGYERQAVITAAAGTLAFAGLWDDSQALLKANLSKSHSPYYLMSQLGGNARKLGRTDEALRWYRQAFDTSEGPATRLQWGASYLNALVEMAPQDAARIEATAAQMLSEAGRDAGAFEGRSARSLERMGQRLSAWNGDGRHAAAMRRLQAQADAVCAKATAAGAADTAEPARATCRALGKAFGAPSA